MLADMGAFGRDDLAERLMAWLLLGNLALSAAGSFRRERENGVLELLLISPLDESQIVGGRLRGLWAQFLPAWALLMGVWLYFQTVFGDNNDTFPSEHFLSFCFLSRIVLCDGADCRGFIIRCDREILRRRFFLLCWSELFCP